MEATLGQAEWRKSSRSGQTGNCVEVAGNLPGIVAVRDSWDPNGPALILTPAAWRALTLKVRNGGVDLAAPLPQRTSVPAALHIPLEDGEPRCSPATSPGPMPRRLAVRVHGRKPAACPVSQARTPALGRLRLRSC